MCIRDSYYTVLQGYHDCNLDDSVFKDAVKNSADRFMEEQNSEPNLFDDEAMYPLSIGLSDISLSLIHI